MSYPFSQFLICKKGMKSLKLACPVFTARRLMLSLTMMTGHQINGLSVKAVCIMKFQLVEEVPDNDSHRIVVAFGPTYSAVAPQFVIGDSTVHDICKEVSEAIVTAMQTEYLPTPTRQTWERSAERFNRLRQFPKTLGAIDKKHIAIVKPEHSGAAFFNYKKFYSIVLLAIADAESRFLMVDISSPLRHSLGSPEAALPPNEEGSLPFIFLRDGGFGCTDLVLTPFTDRGADSQEKIAFNGQLSRARSAVEHAFGIFAKRWRIFLGTIEARPETARLYTLAAVILHNFLKDPVEEEDLNSRFPDDRRMLIDQRAPEAGWQGRLIRDRFVDVVIRGVQDVV
uniref:DDE Tnp4 domain-containing protein n=1 Tax=Ditylenchus dipsaci TaxID=166011 RepID=A0A915DU80_9BILA